MLTTAIGISSCSNTVTPGEYYQYINNPKNGLVQEKKVGHLTFRCEYKPAAFLLLNEKNKAFNTDKQPFNEKELLDEANQFVTFHLKISSDVNSDFLKADLQNQNQYYERLNYYNANITNDFVLIHQNDTIPCNYTYLERNFGIGNETTLIVGFQKEHFTPSGNLQLYLYERAFNIGQMQFDFSISNINNIPKVKL